MQDASFKPYFKEKMQSSSGLGILNQRMHSSTPPPKKNLEIIL
jgi:hypothetical protein